jgi:hypothetical protein
MLNSAVNYVFTESIGKEIKVYERAQSALLFNDAAVRTVSKRVTIS